MMSKQALLEHVLDMFLTSKQMEQINIGWNTFYNEPLKYQIYADMVKQFLSNKQEVLI